MAASATADEVAGQPNRVLIPPRRRFISGYLAAADNAIVPFCRARSCSGHGSVDSLCAGDIRPARIGTRSVQSPGARCPRVHGESLRGLWMNDWDLYTSTYTTTVQSGGGLVFGGFGIGKRLFANDARRVPVHTGDVPRRHRAGAFYDCRVEHFDEQAGVVC